MSAPVLNTDHLIIRAFQRKDLEQFARYRASDAVARYQSWTDFTYNDAVELFESTDYSTFGRQGSWYQLAITTCQEDELVGDLAVFFAGQDQVEIGFTIAPQHQHQNIASEAVSRLLDYLFGDLCKHRVVATTDARNTAANRLLEKLGFGRKRQLTQSVFFKGEWAEEYRWVLLSSEEKFT